MKGIGINTKYRYCNLVILSLEHGIIYYELPEAL